MRETIKSKYFYGLLVMILLFPVSLYAERITVLTRQNYYTTERKTEILCYVKDKEGKIPYIGDIYNHYNNDQEVITGFPVMEGMNRVALSLVGFQEGEDTLQCVIRDGKGKVILDTLVTLTVLPPKSNEVKIDRLTGSLIVDNLPFFPFGFYTHSPVYPTLPEEEVVRGFNLMSPYQKIEKKSFRQRKKYMNRCAELGMKVNYNLLSVAGGGGIGSKMDNMTEEEKRKLLIHEVLAFKDHPALLSWYIADEPVGQNRPPEPLIETYRLIKKLDPYHPVTMVFMAPRQAGKYADAMDIVMADPYPIPNHPVTEVEDVSRLLRDTFYPEKALWIVPQAFGGSEVWQREPTPGEIRVMTYLAMINGARGIQYFIRNGLNGFPKSVATWDECGRMAMETAELTPYYCQGRVVPALVVDKKNIRVRGWIKGNNLVVVCVNTENQPADMELTFPDTMDIREAGVMFENRWIPVSKHHLTDKIDAYGTRVYKISLSAQPATEERNKINMMVDPGFEYLPVPGVPSACYARVGKDRGSTYFVDARVAHSGEHSLRLVTPENGDEVVLSFFPVHLEYGSSYRLTLWAKAAPRDHLRVTKGFFRRLFHRKPLQPKFSIRAGELAQKSFALTTAWKKYEIFISQNDSTQQVMRMSLGLSLDTRGMAWFDDLAIVPVLEVQSEINKPGESLRLSLHTPVDSMVIRYDLRGNQPDITSPVCDTSLLLEHDADLMAGVFRRDDLLGTYHRSFVIHEALGREVDLVNLFSARYDASGFNALTDGQIALTDFRDPCWQGYLYDDLIATIDLDTVREIHDIETHFLQQTPVWIFYPAAVSFYVSSDGEKYSLIYLSRPDKPSRAEGPEVLTVRYEERPVRGRYVRMVAKNTQTCPAWAPGAGGKAWLFCDEIIIR